MTDSQSFGKRRRSTEGKRARKNELLEAARAAFEDKGYAQTSVAAIVRRAGVAQGTFYLYFEGKEHVVVHLRARALEDYVTGFERALKGEAPAHVRLVKGFRALARVTKKHLALLGVIREASSGQETQQVWIEGRATLAAPLSTLIEAGVEEGVFEVDDPMLAAHFVLNLMDDLLYEALVYRRPAGPRITERFGMRFALRGLGTPSATIDEVLPPGR